MSVETKRILEINSWSIFFSYANSLKEKEKGDLFEFLTKQILITKPEYSSKLKNVWLYNEIPISIRDKLNLPSRDEGIDIVTETFQGQYWAIQCKFKGHNESPTYKELSTFAQLVNNYCKNISLALLVHTGERGVRKSHLLGEKYSEIGLEFWLGLTEEDWIRIHKSIKHQSIRPKPRKPRPHQQQAINGAVRQYLENKATRGRLIMPCGTGKSLTAFWIANALKAKSIIVAVPSLSLIRQSLEDWTREFLALNENPKPEWLVICSDESTSKLEKDEFVSEAYSLGIPTTTDIDEIHSFLTKEFNGRKIIFATYQSSDKLAQAATKFHFSFDLAILDEAHKTVGIKTKSFATLLLEKNIHVQRRLFMTATERIFRGDNDEVLSMDDPDVYGDLFYQLSFKEAIHSEPPIISDYKILTITVTSDEIEQLIARNKLITDNQKQIGEQDSQSLAAAIALRKAVQNYGIKHSISFHRSIKGADNFSKLNRKLNVGEIDNILLESFHISSKKSAGERARLMNNFVNVNPSLITNARCLTEGVDIPTIDCVLFADPKQSTIDIVQASGRALRPYAGKEFGYIMLPLIVPNDISLDEFMDSTPFKDVVRIVSALSTQDEMIAEEFRVISSGGQAGGMKITIDGSIPVGLKLDLREFADKINTKIWEKVAKINWLPFELARSFVHKLNLVAEDEWRIYVKSGSKPFDIPSNPGVVYKGIGWKSMGDWLGTGRIATHLRKYRPFEEARSYVHRLNLRNEDDWREYSKSGEKPFDIPATPSAVYSGKGWISIGDWLGTGTIAPFLIEFLPFEEAKFQVHRLNLKNSEEWHKYCLSGTKPSNIPSNPDKTYKDTGWQGMGDWLGTGIIASQNIKFLPFQDARKFVQSLKLKSNKEWRKYCLTGERPNNIPTNPHTVYLQEGWISYGDWLGTDRIASRKIVYRKFTEARRFVHQLKLKDGKEWKQYCKSGSKPDDIPIVPAQTYKDEGWTGMGDWLGTGTIAKSKMLFLPFEEAKAFVHQLKLKNREQWVEYCKSGEKPENIPASPNGTYKDKGWKGMGDWLGTGTIAPFLMEYLPFEEAKAFVHNQNLKNQREWNQYCKSGRKPDNIPNRPDSVYRDKGWMDLGDWLGTGRIASRKRKYRTYLEARAFVQRFKFKNINEWFVYAKSEKKPEDIPAHPQQTYKGKGWTGYGDWLGTGRIATHIREYRSFEDSRSFVHTLNLKYQAEWVEYSKSSEKPQDIPASPATVYSGQGWKGMGDWLGTGAVAARLKKYRPFEEARAFVHQLNLRNNSEWLLYCKSGEKPDDIPTNAYNTYKNKGWQSIGDWLGTGAVSNKNRKYRSYKEAKDFVNQLNLKNNAEWREYIKSGNKPDDIPSQPDRTFKGKGWSNWGDWLGTGTICARLKKYTFFIEARSFAHKLNLTSVQDWKNYCKSGTKPDDIPANPYGTYSDKGWVSWDDWLGKAK